MLLITGITGHSGTFFLQELINHQYSGMIRCIVRPSSDTSLIDQSKLHIEKAVGDLTDQAFVDSAMEGIDTVFHIAGIHWTKQITRAAAKSNVDKIILVHTTGIYSKYKSASAEYTEIEREAVELLNQSSRQNYVIILRPTMIYGYPGDKNMITFIKMVDKLRLFPVINGGTSLLQPVNGRDLGKAYFQLLNTPDLHEGDFILSGDKPISMITLFQTIAKLLGKKNHFISVPVTIGVLIARVLKGLSLGRIDYIEKVMRMAEDRSYSHTAAANAFGYQPMALEEGLKLEIDAYLEKQRI